MWGWAQVTLCPREREPSPLSRAGGTQVPRSTLCTTSASAGSPSARVLHTAAPQEAEEPLPVGEGDPTQATSSPGLPPVLLEGTFSLGRGERAPIEGTPSCAGPWEGARPGSGWQRPGGSVNVSAWKHAARGEGGAALWAWRAPRRCSAAGRGSGVSAPFAGCAEQAKGVGSGCWRRVHELQAGDAGQGT